jgi:hypothetical protein
MIGQHLAEDLDCVDSLQTKPQNVLQCIQRKADAPYSIQNYHIKRSSGCTLAHINMHMKAFFVGAPVNQGMNELAIVMEGEYSEHPDSI